MDDAIKGLTLGFFSLLILHGSLQNRARRDTERYVSAAFNHTGTVRAAVAPRGMFGLLVDDIWAVDVFGEGVVCDYLPFYREPKAGWKGHTRHLRLHLTNFTLAGLPIDSMEADVPFVKFDYAEALYHDRLVIRNADAGRMEVTIGEAGLTAFISNKFKQTLSDVNIVISNNQLTLSANLLLLGTGTKLDASGSIAPRDGRYLDLIQPEIRINGKPAQPTLLKGILSRINPILDAEKDLNVGGFFMMDRVRFQGQEVIVDGTVTLPLRSATPGLPTNPPADPTAPSKRQQ